MKIHRSQKGNQYVFGMHAICTQKGADRTEWFDPMYFFGCIFDNVSRQFAADILRQQRRNERDAARIELVRRGAE